VRTAILATVAATCVTVSVGSQHARPADFDFLEGVWEFTETFSQPTASGRTSATGRWTARTIGDGRVLEDEFRVFGPDGETTYLALTFRAWDAVAGQWTFRLVETGSGAWSEGTARRVGGEIHLEQRGPVRPDGSRRRLRIRYYDIRADRFSWTADLSPDDGVTWIPGAIRIEARRVAS